VLGSIEYTISFSLPSSVFLVISKSLGSDRLAWVSAIYGCAK